MTHDASRCVNADNVDIAFDELELDFEQQLDGIPILVKRANTLVKRTGRFGERRCEKDAMRVWYENKDKCLSDEQVLEDKNLG